MTCYHPMLRIENQHIWKVADDGHKYHPAIIEQPDDIYKRLDKVLGHPFYKYQIIPCRKCIGCRLDYSRQWANRGYLESMRSENNYFVTLTYDEEHIKINDEITTKDGITYVNTGDWTGTLEPQELTKFVKRFRKGVKEKYGIENLKYMACGEYGGKTARPHYHLILFNCPLPAETFYNSRIINKQFYWQNKVIEKYWDKGISNITEASWNTIAYVARYITKKIYGKHSDDEYASNGQEKEFFRVSKGVGKEYYEKNKHKIYSTDQIIVKNRNGHSSAKPPKYFDLLYEKENPKDIERIKEKRKEQQKNAEKVKDTQTSYTRLEQLEVRERSHIEKHKQLVRNLENSF